MLGLAMNDLNMSISTKKEVEPEISGIADIIYGRAQLPWASYITFEHLSPCCFRKLSLPRAVNLYKSSAACGKYYTNDL